MTDREHAVPPTLLVVPDRPVVRRDGDDALRPRLHLHQLRETKGLTQRALGERLNVQQPAVAKMERRSDMYVSNLRAYIEALGGTLRFVAEFPDGSVDVFPPGSDPEIDCVEPAKP